MTPYTLHNRSLEALYNGPHDRGCGVRRPPDQTLHLVFIGFRVEGIGVGGGKEGWLRGACFSGLGVKGQGFGVT